MISGLPKIDVVLSIVNWKCYLRLMAKDVVGDSAQVARDAVCAIAVAHFFIFLNS